MTMDEYVKTLGEMNALPGLTRTQFEKYVNATYGKDALLIKPSLYFRLFTRPWNFVCAPFNKLLRWIGDHMPLYDSEGNPMSDKWIHFSAMLKMAGFIPMQDYGWHIVDEQPISEISPKKFKRYFKSQYKATAKRSLCQVDAFISYLHSEYEGKRRS